ncbi:MAG: GMC family oxidoreductase [Gammaproteobacteria bacterium]|nr:GMC family oxidoreductase [Gammaproteobacteria bacterium]
MLVDHTQFKGDATRYDLCIIGAGACGITIAREFNGRNAKVALVESGAFEPSTVVHELYDGETSGVREGYLMQTRLRLFGGTTNHWGGLCRPFDELDFKQRDWISHSVAWPFTRRELEPFYERAAGVVELPPFFASGPPSSDLVDESCELSALLFRFSPPTRFGSAYRQELLDSDNVSVFLNCNAADLPLTDNKSGVESLKIVTNDRRTFHIRAKQFVLATGGLENPRFLLNCNNDIEAGLGNHSDLVGRYFMSHAPVGGLGAVSFTGKHTASIVERVVLKAADHTGQQPPRRYVRYVGIKEAVQRRLGLLNQGFAFWRAIEDLPEDLQRFVDVSGAFSKFHSGDGTSATFGLTSVAEQSPNPNSRVSLADERDFTGMRKIKFDFRTNPLDRESVAKSIEFLATELGRLGLGRVRFDIDDPVDLPFNPDDHHMGTTRMHEDPKLGVVDVNAKVHGLRNLFVTGGSVFPSGGFANPTITMVAVALRLADHLKGIV